MSEKDNAESSSSRTKLKNKVTKYNLERHPGYSTTVKKVVADTADGATSRPSAFSRNSLPLKPGDTQIFTSKNGGSGVGSVVIGPRLYTTSTDDKQNGTIYVLINSHVVGRDKEVYLKTTGEQIGYVVFELDLVKVADAAVFELQRGEIKATLFCKICNGEIPIKEYSGKTKGKFVTKCNEQGMEHCHNRKELGIVHSTEFRIKTKLVDYDYPMIAIASTCWVKEELVADYTRPWSVEGESGTMVALDFSTKSNHQDVQVIGMICGIYRKGDMVLTTVLQIQYILEKMFVNTGKVFNVDSSTSADSGISSQAAGPSQEYSAIASQPDKTKTLGKKPTVNGEEPCTPLIQCDSASLRSWQNDLYEQQILTAREKSVTKRLKVIEHAQQLLSYENEEKRVNTFKWFPPRSTSFIKMMASTGLYFTLDGDRTKCFSCGIQIDGWTYDMNPMERHADANPECSIIKELQARENIPHKPKKLGEKPTSLQSKQGTSAAKEEGAMYRPVKLIGPDLTMVDNRSHSREEEMSDDREANEPVPFSPKGKTSARHKAKSSKK